MDQPRTRRDVIFVQQILAVRLDRLAKRVKIMSVILILSVREKSFVSHVRKTFIDLIGRLPSS